MTSKGGAPPARGADLGPVREAFERFGAEDPMHAALTRAGTEDNRWDPEAFFENGRQEITDLLEYVGSLTAELRRDRALDFGCAVGRLTQALADHFREAVGVDIASAMIEAARAHNRHGGRVRYILNTAPDLDLLETASFDLVYTNKVLQHIPPAAQYAYIREFMRVLRPGGVAVFQTRNGPRIEPGTPRALLYTINRRYIRRLSQRLRGRVPYEMHFVARARVEEEVARAGGRTVDVVDLSRGRAGKSLRYCAVRG